MDDNDASPEPGEKLSPPPLRTFGTDEAAYEYIQAWARDHGYCLRKRRSTKTRDGIWTKSTTYVCDAQGHYEVKGQQRRHRESKQQDCSFQLKVNRRDRGYYIAIDDPSHNHEPSWSFKAHPIHRRRDPATRETIHAQIRAGTRPQEIMTGLRHTGVTNILTRDVYNEGRSWRDWQLDGKTPIEALLLLLQDSSEWTFNYKLDTNGRLTHLFAAYNKAITVFQSHPDLLMADCTYKTNRFSMPLLHFIGVDASNKHFSAAFVIMPDELEPSYLWACQQLNDYIFKPINYTPNTFGSDNETALKNAAKEVWRTTPQWLCYWHIQKNVQTAVKKYLNRVNGPFEASTEDKELEHDFRHAFDVLNRSHDEAEYERRWAKLRQDYLAYPELVRYLREHQYPQRKEVARAWTSELPHYGNSTTSKLEGAHKTVKGYLKGTQGDLLTLITSIENALGNWVHEYEGWLARHYNRPKPPADAKKIDCCNNHLNKYITNFAMDLFAKQLAIAQSDKMTPQCSGAFKSIFGIPCCHTIALFIDDNRQFEADDFNTHWLWERDDVESTIDIAAVVAERKANKPLIFEPASVVRKRGRPKYDKRRDPSRFEMKTGTKRRVPESTLKTTPIIAISDDEESDHEYPDDYDLEDFIDINDPRFAEQVDLTATAPKAATPAESTANRAASKARTPKPTVSRTIQPKKRGRIGKARKEEATRLVVTALSAAGCSANTKQIAALDTDWYTNDVATSFGNLLMALTRADGTASKKQHGVIDRVLKDGQ